jgi:2-polyprenyl-3-methyl-5-hydroxy-6-metoxy-1,4-benzoquinol methylase
MSDPETLGVYAQQADKYARMTHDANTADPILHAFVQCLPEGGHVLDLGCGPGDSAAKMAANGFRVTATDAVAEMVDLASKHDGVTAKQATFDDISGTDIYDGIWANFSLLHASKSDMPRHLAALSQALKPGGVLHIALKTGTGERRDKIGRHYSYYTQDELTGLLGAAGLKVQNVVTGSGTGLDGSISEWMAVRAHD